MFGNNTLLIYKYRNTVRTSAIKELTSLRGIDITVRKFRIHDDHESVAFESRPNDSRNSRNCFEGNYVFVGLRKTSQAPPG